MSSVLQPLLVGGFFLLTPLSARISKPDKVEITAVETTDPQEILRLLKEGREIDVRQTVERLLALSASERAAVRDILKELALVLEEDALDAHKAWVSAQDDSRTGEEDKAYVRWHAKACRNNAIRQVLRAC